MSRKNKVVARKATRVKTKPIKRYTGKNVKRLYTSLIVYGD